MKWLQQNDQWIFYEASKETIELDTRSEKEILDQSANEILELDCESNKTSIGFLIKNERNSVLQWYRLNKFLMNIETLFKCTTHRLFQ